MKRRRVRSRILCWALIAASAAALPAAATDQGAWTLYDRDDGASSGYALYRRQGPGEAFSTWRLEAELPAPPEVVWRVTLADLLESHRASAGRRRSVLRREGDVFWIHTEISVPLVADRDLVLRMERRRDPATGALRIEWRADPAAGPPPAEGVVRMVVSRGFWEFTPAADGRTHARYESYAEPGGPFPAWLVDSISSGQVLEGLADLRRSLAEAGSELPPVAAGGGGANVN